MSKLSSEANWTETSVANHNVFHPALKSDVFGGTDTQVLSVSQAAALMGLSERDILDLVDDKVLCAKKDLSGKHWLIEKECALAQRKSFGGSVAEPEVGEEDPVIETVLAELESADEIGITELFGPDASINTAFNTDDDGTMTAVEVETEDRLPPAPVEVFAGTGVDEKYVREVLDSLDFANVRLEGAMYRIGYLEAQVDSMEEQLKVLPEFRSRAAQAILVDRENDLLKEKIADHEAALEETNKILEHFAGNRWYRFWAWVFGVKLPA